MTCFQRHIGHRFCLLLPLLLAAGPVFGSDAERFEPAAVQPLARGWSAFYSHEPHRALAAVEGLLASRQASNQAHALHLKARSLWSQTDEAAQNEARDIWQSLARQTRRDVFTVARSAIAQALMLIAEGSGSQASDLLENVIQKHPDTVVSIEAALELALLHAETNRLDDAREQLDQAEGVLNMADSHDIPKPIAEALHHGVKQTRDLLGQPARLLFTRAQGLQRERRFKQAIGLYEQLKRDHADSDYAPRGQVQVGACYLGMGQQQQAIDHWRGFIGSAPAGAWRGQAYLRLIDLHLLRQLDPGAAELQVRQGLAALERGLADSRGGASWKAAAYELHLSAGMVDLVRGRGEAAAPALRAARAAMPDGGPGQRLDRLAALARDGVDLVPEDVRAGGVGGAGGRGGGARGDDPERAALALTLGMIHHVLGHQAQAMELFDRVAGTAEGDEGGLTGATVAQRAFAGYARGMVLQDEGRAPETREAREAYAASLRDHPEGSWHDETLFRLAGMIDSGARADYLKAREEGRDDAEEIRAKALPYWRRLVAEHKESPKHEIALLRLGVLLYERADAVSLRVGRGGEAARRDRRVMEEVDEVWMQAVGVLRGMVETYPGGLRAGDAYARLMDIGLERLFDLEMAAEMAPAAGRWARDVRLPDAPGASTVGREPWRRQVSAVTEEQLAQARHDCLFRAAIICHLAEDRAQALEFIQLAGPGDPRSGFSEGLDLTALGARGLMDVIVRKRGLPNEREIGEAQNDAQRMALRLGKLYMSSLRFPQAEAVFMRVIENEPRLGDVSPELQAVGIMSLADAMSRQRGRRDQSLVWLQKLVDRQELEGSYWHGYGLFRLGVTTFNHTQDNELVLPIYQRMIDSYPNHEMTETAFAYYCNSTIRTRDRNRAKAAVERFVARYPESEFRPRVEERLRELLEN